MEFTERKELENLIQYSQSFRHRDGIPQNDILEASSVPDDTSEPLDQEVLSSCVSPSELAILQNQTLESIMDDIKVSVKLDEQNNLEMIRQLNMERIKEKEKEKEKQLLDQQEVQLQDQQMSTNSIKQTNDSNVQQQNGSQVVDQMNISEIVDSVKERKSEQSVGGQYCKQNEGFLESLFDKAKGRKSLFTERIKTNSQGGLQFSSGGQGNSKIIKIYFFNTQNHIKLKVFKLTTVKDVLKQAIESYLKDPLLDKSLVKYPNNITDAYEIRLLDDDESGKADMDMAAIDRNKSILSTQSEYFALINNSSFVLPRQQDNAVFTTITPVNKNIIFLMVDIRDENQEQSLTTTIPVEQSQTIKDVFEVLYRKNKKYNDKEYVAKIKFQQDDDFVEVDLKMPVIQILSKSITLFTKVWADQCVTKKQSTIIQPGEIQQDTLVIGPMNQSQAYNRENFDVIKINEKGKRQERILGINQLRIYNLSRKPSMFREFFTSSKTGTQNPERLIEDILDVRVDNQLLYITFREEGIEKTKELKFDTMVPKVAQYIEQKLKFIIRNSGQMKKIERSQSLSNNHQQT